MVFFRKIYFLYFIIITSIVLSPFIILPSYSVPLWSGDFGGFLSLYSMPKDLIQIKSILQSKPGLSLILPTFESGRVLQDTQYNFIDKFLIYYFNTPFLYYGSSADTNNKFKVFEAYESMLEGGDWWDKYLQSVLGVDYIIVPDTEARLKGGVYLFGIENSIQKNLASSTVYQLEYKGLQYDLYEKKNQSLTADKRVQFLDMSPKMFGKTISTTDFTSSQVYLPLDASLLVANNLANREVVTDKPKDAYFDLLDQYYPEIIRYRPDETLAPFNKTYILSTDYSTTPLALASLLQKYLNPMHLVMDNLVNTTEPNFLVTLKESNPF